MVDMTTTKCFSCQVDDKQAAGERITVAERNHRMLWGCTCDPAVSAEAQDFMDRVTR